jgi:cytochrome c
MKGKERMKRVLIALGILAAGVLLSLALARVHPFGDPQITAPHPSSVSLLKHTSIPPEARAILTQKCADCHSAETRSPWYGRFAPASWLMERDITEAREHMDLSRWESLTDDQIGVLQSEIVQQTRTRAMPPVQYRLMHAGSAITDADVRTLTAWVKADSLGRAAADVASAIPNGAPAGGAVASSGSATPESAPGTTTPGDAARGKQVFEARCTGCHTLNQNREGPKLAGVVGRTSGTADGFTYSAALKKAGIRWDPQTLDRWLADPDSLVPDNDMEFHVSKAQERSDLIAYLQASK